jgi:hypothetical protein
MWRTVAVAQKNVQFGGLFFTNQGILNPMTGAPISSFASKEKCLHVVPVYLIAILFQAINCLHAMLTNIIWPICSNCENSWIRCYCRKTNFSLNLWPPTCTCAHMCSRRSLLSCSKWFTKFMNTNDLHWLILHQVMQMPPTTWTTLH